MGAHYLVTAIGGDIGSSVIRCLSQEFLKEDLFGCDITPYVPGYDEVSKLLLVPVYTDEQLYIHVLLDKCKECKITHVLPMTEGEIKVLDKYRKIFDSVGIKVMIQNTDVLNVAFSKYNTAKTLEKIGLNIPKTWKKEENIKDEKYPLIIKPDRGCGSKEVRIVKNRQEYEAAISQISDAVVQEYIGDSENEYTVGVFSNGKEIKVIAFRRTLGFGGMSRMVERVEDEKINIIAESVANMFQLRGSINIQMRKQNNNYYIFEINPRISSTVGFRYMLGFKDIKWWLDLLDGKEDKISYIPEELPIVGIRTLGEKIFKADLRLTEKFELYNREKKVEFVGM